MRLVSTLPHPQFAINVYAWNGKYLLKFEQAMLEQTYKIAELDLNGDPDVSTLLEDSDFMAFVQDTFNQMAKNLNRSLNKLSL
jgi:hypothetical protein